MEQSSPSKKCCTKCSKRMDNLLKCSVCLKARYCSTSCQKEDFARHKSTCKKAGVLRMFKSIQSGDEEEVRKLAKIKYVLNGKVDFQPEGENEKKLSGWAPLHEANRQGNKQLEIKMAKILLDSPHVKVDIRDGDGETPLFNAASGGNTEIVKLLLDAGANPNFQMLDGWTPLMMACRSGLLEETKLLLEAGASVSLGSDMFGRNAYDIVSFTANSGEAIIRSKRGESYDEARVRFSKLFDVLNRYYDASERKDIR